MKRRHKRFHCQGSAALSLWPTSGSISLMYQAPAGIPFNVGARLKEGLRRRLFLLRKESRRDILVDLSAQWCRITVFMWVTYFLAFSRLDIRESHQRSLPLEEAC